ncbi:MAG: hypothetical protein Q9183_007761 [Haloplaca sp. 2 TL-2023]
MAPGPTKSYRGATKPEEAQEAPAVGEEAPGDGALSLATHAAEETAHPEGPQGEPDLPVAATHDVPASALAPAAAKVATFITGSSLAPGPLPKRVYGRGELMTIGKAYKWALTMAMVNTEGEKRVGVAMLT